MEITMIEPNEHRSHEFNGHKTEREKKEKIFANYTSTTMTSIEVECMQKSNYQHAPVFLCAIRLVKIPSSMEINNKEIEEKFEGKKEMEQKCITIIKKHHVQFSFLNLIRNVRDQMAWN